MNRIYLDKLCNFALTTYKNYELGNKNTNIEDFINNIKQNQSLNESGIFFKHNFIELKSLISNIEYDQLVLINPLCFNLSGNIKWYNFLNSLLTIMNDNYLHEANLVKKVILETADKTFRKKMIIDKEFGDETIEQICILTNITLIILSKFKKNKCYNKKNNSQKIVLMVNIGTEYFSILNWKQKYFDWNSEFVTYLSSIDNNDELKQNEICEEHKKFTNVESKKKKKNLLTNFDIDEFNESNKFNKSEKPNKIVKKKSNNIFDCDEHNISDDELDNELDNEPNIKNTNSNVDNDISEINPNNKGAYEELHAEENYALYVSEVVDISNTNDISKKDKTMGKNKKKNDKNIFVTGKMDKIKTSKSAKTDNLNEINEQNMKNELDDNSNTKTLNSADNECKETSIFNKTEKITKEDLKNISNTIKITMGLEVIQSHALKLDIGIFEGSTKTGKPKNKTKAELIQQIKEHIKNLTN